jgi:hypothetical protein
MMNLSVLVGRHGECFVDVENITGFSFIYAAKREESAHFHTAYRPDEGKADL